ncbi:MAG: efflux RND transporter periplasmic adaptor subunit [Candidatus Binatia bacterium]|nr:efflux RND transporter periplasmic adaptor subunit [Candidatus Binatia bacterium]MDG2008760.1 efflux RND transporter periplasmic adaptor subunit [Candidatus Binatia bacterium]
MKASTDATRGTIAGARRRAPGLVALLAIVAMGCGKPELPKAPTPEVLTAQSTQMDIPIYGEWVGTTEGYVNAQIRPKVQGYLLKQNYENGAEVASGELMFEIDPRQFQADVKNKEGALDRAKATLKRSDLNVARFRPLAKRGAVSQKELDDAVQTELANRASVQSAAAALEKARLNLDWSKIKAPIRGLAGIAVAQIGDLVGPPDLLTTVSTIDPIKVAFPISEQQYLRLKRSLIDNPSRDASPATLILTDATTYKHPGKFLALGRDINPETGTILVETGFPNPDGLLRPGQYARVRVRIDLLKGATVVPQRALKDMQGTFQVAVVKGGDTIEMRTVEVGPTYKTLWIIEKGIKPGETVVVEGLQDIRDGSKVVSKPAPAPSSAATPTSSANGGN